MAAPKKKPAAAPPRVLCLLALVLCLGCSNDTELPTAYHRDYLPAPTDVRAVFEDAAARVTWQPNAGAAAVGHVVGFTDSSGAETTRLVDGAATAELVETALDLSPGRVYVVRVWAVDEQDFFGPRSAPDSLIVPQ